MPETSLSNWIMGKDTSFDVTPLQARFAVKAADRAGHALEARFEEKMTKHWELCRGEG